MLTPLQALEIAKEVGCDLYDLGKREAYMNQRRVGFDSNQLASFANALITKYIGEPVAYEWIDEFGEKCWTDNLHVRPTDATALYALKERK